MTEEIFHEGMDLLIASKRPYKWTSDSKGAYWAALKNFDGKEFYAACKRLNITEEEMPSIGRIAREINPSKMGVASACPMCDDGKVRFQFAGDGVKYERYAACSCDAGYKVARHLIQMQKLRADEKGIALSHEKLNPESYTLTAIRMKYGDAVLPERHMERKSVYDVEVPEDAHYLRRRRIESFKKTMIRIIEKTRKTNAATVDTALRQSA